MALTPFDFAGYFVDSAKDLVAAREKAFKLHGNKDIDAAGDEIEIPVREMLRARLSRRYYVGHGHIVDSRLMTSRQLDLIVADEANTPVLFKSRNGTEFVPYESVYAFGEARSTYYKSKKPIQGFSEVVKEIGLGLARQKITFAMGTNGATNVVRQNPLGLNAAFTFMFFVSGEEFDFGDVREFYKATPVEHLPCVVCILDKGVVVRAAFENSGGRNVMKRIILDPATAGAPSAGEVHRWTFFRANDADADRNMGFALALFFLALFGSLSNSALLPPDMPVYLNQVLAGFPAKMDA